MELSVHFTHTNKKTGITTYGINPDLTHGCPPPDVVERFMKKLRPRIEKMARKQLGESFLALRLVGSCGLDLDVKTGTIVEKKDALNNLLGWIAVFDTK